MGIDVGFHEFVYQLSGNPLIGEAMRVHWLHLRRAVAETLKHSATPLAGWQERETVLEEMARGNAERAVSVMKEHLANELSRHGNAKVVNAPASLSSTTSAGRSSARLLPVGRKSARGISLLEPAI